MNPVMAEEAKEVSNFLMKFQIHSDEDLERAVVYERHSQIYLKMEIPRLNHFLIMCSML